MASGIPKRATNVKRKERRAASWRRGQEKKAARMAEQEKNEKRNKELGTTAKQRANQKAKLNKALTNSAAGDTTDLGDFTQYAEQEDLLEL
jgi:hypothetical protein